MNAAGIATINALAPGRTFFGVGSGIGWLLAIAALAAIREKMRYSNVPGPLRVEQCRGVVGILEDERRRLVDGDGTRVRARCRLLSGVHLQCFESVFGAHGSPRCRRGALN